MKEDFRKSTKIAMFFKLLKKSQLNVMKREKSELSETVDAALAQVCVLIIVSFKRIFKF